MAAVRALPHLFSPFTIRNVSLRNRIVSTAHATGLAENGSIGDRLIAYHVARARGGVGLIITEQTTVHPGSTSRHTGSVRNWDDSIIAPYGRLSRAVHELGARLFAQLNHAGAQSGSPGGIRRVVAPSAVDAELSTETPHVLDVDEIEEIVTAFAAAAVRVRAGGLDGIELHGGHGNLIQQFLSPLTNRRTDAYGGSRENRLRFAHQVLTAVRRAVGEDFVVGMRLSAEEHEPGGLTLAEARLIARALTETGRLDYLNVTSGRELSSWSLAMHYAPMYVPSLHLRHLARGIKDAVSVPILAVGRIVDPGDAESLLASGDADLVGMTRAQIADPELANKAARGALEEIRYCVGANEGCLGRLFRGLPISCIHNPTSGREAELGPPRPASRPRRVVVVGGGAAGLEAARVAAERGHRVVLLERKAVLGGQVQLARRAPGRGEFGAVADQLIAAVGRAGVEVRLGCEATVEGVLALEPEAVVVATGSDARVPVLADGEGRLVSARAALEGALVGNPVVVYDTRGDMVGLTTADWLADRGYAVTVVTPHLYVGPLIEIMTWRILYQRLLDKKVQVVAQSEVVGLSEHGVVVRQVFSGAESTLVDAATVVAACGGEATDGLYRQLKQAARGLELHLVGDAAAPRQVEQAVYEGHLAGRAV
ncbi:MAG: FAD-dependent oxidoreductase [Candidatus Rokubacteria bacterium]|nr:FAD-dependent oxidoreductase [Candidatus Rokubacteria bacterium]